MNRYWGSIAPRSARLMLLATISSLACARGQRLEGSIPSSVSVIQPCATRIVVRNASRMPHVLSWVEPTYAKLVRKQIPAPRDTLIPFVAIVERIPNGAIVSIDDVISRHEQSAMACVAPLPLHVPDSLPEDYGQRNALLSDEPGARFPGILFLAFERSTSREQRDSIVLSERLEIVGGVRINDEGTGFWAVWTPDDATAANARALAARLSQIPGVRSARAIGMQVIRINPVDR